VVKNQARDLLRAMADGGDVSTARIHEFASAVIEAPAFLLAQQTLDGKSPEFALRTALELAAVVLGAPDRVAGNREEPMAVVRTKIETRGPGNARRFSARECPLPIDWFTKAVQTRRCGANPGLVRDLR